LIAVDKDPGVLSAEARTRQRDQTAAELVRLDPGETKNGDGRVVHVTPELRSMLDAQVERVRELERSQGRIIRWLFPHLDAAYVGARIADPRKAWRAACVAAGHPAASSTTFVAAQFAILSARACRARSR